MQTIDYPPVQQALDRLKGLSADADTRRLAFVRERALLDEATALHEAAARGEAKALTLLLTKRFGPLSPDTANRLQAASAGQLEIWLDRVLDAPTLDAVFAER